MNTMSMQLVAQVMEHQHAPPWRGVRTPLRIIDSRTIGGTSVTGLPALSLPDTPSNLQAESFFCYLVKRDSAKLSVSVGPSDACLWLTAVQDT